jgi:DNA-binding MarR family transcriptional regulator
MGDIVHIMNDDSGKSLDPYRSYLLLSEISGEQTLSQREISRRLGLAVGLVNSYLKNLVAKGFVRVKNFPSNRYAYLLTPQGIAEKSRLAYQHLSYFTGLYTTARQDYLTLFRELELSGVREVVFCGVDEVAEIAYLSLQETGVRLAAVLDNGDNPVNFFGLQVRPISGQFSAPVVVTSLKRTEELLLCLDRAGVEKKYIYQIPHMKNSGGGA